MSWAMYIFRGSFRCRSCRRRGCCLPWECTVREIFYDMKGVAEEFLDQVGMKKRIEYDGNAGRPYLHPGRQANILYEGTEIGYLGEIHPQVADRYGIGERTYVAVIDILKVMDYATFDRKYEGIARFPAVTRDLSMVVPKEIQAAQIEHMIIQRGGKILESVQLFDIYEGAQIQEGCKSMAYSVVFRSREKTLEEQEVAAAMKKIIDIRIGLGIQLRQ